MAGVTRARESWQQPMRHFAVNTAGTVDLLTAMETASVRPVVFASTGSIYDAPDQQPLAETLLDDPPHPYAGSKLAAERAIKWQARSGKLSRTILRMFNVAGRLDLDTTRIIPRA